VFLDIRDRIRSAGSEQGLLGLAFHPNFLGNGFFYVNYTDGLGNTVVSRFTASTVAGPTPPGSERMILTLTQPASNHNGGHLAFGPDGYLYIGTGDGGGGGDTFRNGQNGQTLLGAMLRLDVDSSLPFAIPADNPYVGIEGVRDEIWAFGLRNPWRYAFDRLTGDLFIADVGQNDYEEINVQPASSLGGENYGWPVMEGRQCFPSGTTCQMVVLTFPIHEYDHSQGCSITGGYVYRGLELPSAAGVYVFGDFCTGRIWGLFSNDGSSRTLAELGRSDIRITSFGEDESGELYVVGVGSAGRGELNRLRFFDPIVLPANE
jgi:glucose/arabinose dehydrogenase